MENVSLHQAILLGLVQGLTEFLPISSSAHLVFLQSFFHLENAAGILAFDVALHLGTLLAVVFFYRRDLGRMIPALWDWKRKQELRLIFLIFAATLPAVFAGLFFHEELAQLFASPRATAIQLILTGVILWVSNRFYRKPRDEEQAVQKENSFFRAFLIGVAQAVAIIPGISRSGATICAGLFLGFRQSFAAHFSFLMSIPAILGAVVLEAPEIQKVGTTVLPQLITGTVVAALSGFVAIYWLLRLMSRGKLHYFAYYCWVMGGIVILLY